MRDRVAPNLIVTAAAVVMALMSRRELKARPGLRSLGLSLVAFLDDHSRLALAVTAHPVVTVQLVLAQFRSAIAECGPPASTLTDNSLVFTTRVRGGRNTFENELNLLGIDQKNGRPDHPQTRERSRDFNKR